jgi:hypothetical protein
MATNGIMARGGGINSLKPGGMAEWTMATVLKTVVAARSPGVRIPLPPPKSKTGF